MLAYTGTGTLPAAVAEASGHAAAVRLPRPGLLAAAETGARLGRLAVIPDAGRDAAEVAAVLLDRRESAVLALGGATVPAARARPLAAKTRGKEAVLLVTGGSWPLPHPSPKPG